MSTDFGSRLRSIREDLDLLQRDVASALRISSGAYSLYERNKREPSLSFIVDFCTHFNVSADYLLGLSDSLHPSSPISINPTIVQRNPLDDLTPDFREQAEVYLAFLHQQQAAQLESNKVEA